QWAPNVVAQRATITRQVSLTDDASFAEQTRGNRGLRFKRFGAAEVFGYFRVTGLNMTGTPRMKDELTAALDVIETFHGAGMHVSRRCGSYVVESTSYVRDTIAEIMEKAAVVEAAHGLRF